MRAGPNDITVSLGEFVTREARERLFTGILFSEGRTPLYLHFRQGQLINIESWDPVYSVAAFALFTGLITTEEYGRIRTAQIESNERFLDLLKKESRADHMTLLRLYEAFAYVTLLHLIHENGAFSATEGAVAPDQTLIEAISPERFTDRLAALVDDQRTSRILILWRYDVAVHDPACGLESGPVATSFIHSSHRFPDHLDILEKALASPMASEVIARARHSNFIAMLLPFILFLVMLLAMSFLYGPSYRQARKEATAANWQLNTLREQMVDAVRSLDGRIRTH